MTSYDYGAVAELNKWQLEMQKAPTAADQLAKRFQDRMNSFIPEKIHKAITVTIRQMIKMVLTGSGFTTAPPRTDGNLELREAVVQEKIIFYKKTAAAEGGITGAGGILMGIADFPLLLGIKLKLLFEIAAVYGFNVDDYKERLYILHIFQLAFNSQKMRGIVYERMQRWDVKAAQLPQDLNAYEWRSLRQEYRDYLDLAKLAQLIPVVGAPIGAVVNYRLITKLGITAMNAYRMRMKEDGRLTPALLQ